MTELKCPCCGQSMGPVKDPMQIPMSAVRQTIMKRLPATIEQLAAAVYVERSNAPEHEYDTIRTTIYRLRTILRPYGWTIDNAKTGGWGQKTYRLMRLP